MPDARSGVALIGTPCLCCAASQTDDRLTEKGAEDSIQASLHAKTPRNNVIVESDGPESDRPETTASMGMHGSTP